MVQLQPNGMVNGNAPKQAEHALHQNVGLREGAFRRPVADGRYPSNRPPTRFHISR